MANYLLLFHGGGAPEGEEAQAQVMDDWTKWFASLGAAVVDAGNPTGVAKTVSSDGSVSDGGGSNPVTGYSVISADNLDAAAEVAKACPHLASGGSIEVSETFSVM